MSNKLIVVSGPSGVGKSTLIGDLLKAYGSSQVLCRAISYTTRPIRGDESKRDYHFISRSEFEALKNQDQFAEWAYVYGYYYGTPLTFLNQCWKEGKAVITDLDIQGADLIKKRFSQALRIFVLAPSISDLEGRILARGQNTKEDMEVRKQAAKQELAKAKEFDHQVINQDRSTAVKKMKFFIDKYLGIS